MSDQQFPKWTPDCSGKWDYDYDLVRLSSRYWPQGGGFFIWDSSKGTFEGNEIRPEIKPSAMSSIVISNPHDDGFDDIAISCNFIGDTEQEVKTQVEIWAKGMMERVYSAIKKEFS
jgi:hypothetical protein